MYRRIRLALLMTLFAFRPTRAWALRRLPKHTKGYKHYWKDASMTGYRKDMHHRQKDMDSNPTFAEMSAAIEKYSPHSVLVVGCGYGRELVALSSKFTVEGCDISEELLHKIDSAYPVFQFDIVEDKTDKTWDVLMCRAVMMYITEPTLLQKAMQNLERMANKKIIVWEWPHICTLMKEAYPSNKFEYRPLQFKKE